jgi:caffeoyl-CoA O-methyltransferase
MARPHSFEVFSHVDTELSLFEVDVLGKETALGSIAPQKSLVVNGGIQKSYWVKQGDKILSRYTGLKKYPQWHVFPDENSPIGSLHGDGRQSNKATDNLLVTPDLYKYILDSSLREHPILKLCRDETLANPNVPAIMQTSPEEAQFLGLFVKALHAKKAIEVGVFTGYSSLAIALNLEKDGKLVALDISDDYTKFARGYWEKAGVASKVDLRLGPAVGFLDELIAQGDKECGTYDFAFIDADKPNYQNYFDRLIKLMRIGGVIAIDNTLWHGRVINSDDETESTVAIRKLNAGLKERTDIELSMLGIGDGVTFALRTR